MKAKSDIMKALWSGDTKRAEEILVSERRRISAEIQALNDELTSLDDIMKPSFLRPSNAAPSGRPWRVKRKRMRKSAKASRRIQVLDVARDMSHGKPVSVQDIATALERGGIDLGVPPKRVNTTVSSILYRSGKFEKLAAGVYRYRGDNP